VDQTRTALRIVGDGSPERLALHQPDGAGSPERLALHESEGARGFQPSDRLGLQPSDCRTTPTVGRRARLELAFERRRGRTVLAHSYAEPPFRVGRTFDLDGAAYAILVCAGPGVFGGDALTASVHVGGGARVVLTSQAALQAHPSSSPTDAPAVLRYSYIVEDDGELHCQWDPLIPFAGARVDQQFDIRLAASGRLYWSDALIAGRVSRGEAWQFTSLAHELSLRIGGRLAYLERYAIAPGDRAVERAWIAGGSTRFATNVISHPRATRETVERLQAHLSAAADVVAGADLVEPSLAVARIMASNGASFGTARASYREWTLASIFQHPELRGRK
jgi:urease accessory protein